MPSPKVSWRLARQIAVKADADPRTVMGLIRAEKPAQPTARDRIVTALKEMGLENLIPADRP